MPRRLLSAVLLGALILAATAVPGRGLVPRVAAASCSGWSSNTEPPPTIRVFRHVSGAVDTVEFKPYTKNVLSREWISSWTTESLRSGALAVRNYAWYQVLHWRGGTNADGECFDLRDDTWDQVYDPSRPTYATAAAAVEDTWGMLVTKNGLIFPTYYNAGAPGEACGANANGWKAFQWGTQACGIAGLSAADIILTYYYPNVTVSGGGATPTPTPSPTPSLPPSPSPTATPSGPGPTAPEPSPSATTTRSPSPTATASPTPTPITTPVPTPPPDQQPGGGQAGIEQASAPPSTPPPAPATVVAQAESEAAPQPAAVTAGADQLRWAAGLERLRRADETWIVSGELPPAGHQGASTMDDLRLAAFRMSWQQALRDLVTVLARKISSERLLARSIDDRR